MRISVSLNRLELTLGACYLVFELFFLPPILALLSDNLPKPLSDGQVNLLFFVLNFVCVGLILRRFLWQNLLIAKNKIHGTLRYAIWGFLLYYGANFLVGSLIGVFFPDFANINDASIMEITQQYPVGMTVGTVFLVPMVEESLFRGVIFRGIYDRSRALSYVVSTVLFSVIHIMGYFGIYDVTTLILCFFQYLPAGIFLAWAYEKSDTIWCPVLIHMTVNQIGILAMR